MQADSNRRIAAIDSQIEAEKRIDGKSAESLARIKALEGKKLQLQRKSFEQQKKIQMIGLGVASLAAGGLAGTVFRLGAAAAYTSSYGAYRQKFQSRQAGTMSSPAISGTTTSEGDTSYTAPTTSVGGTGITGETTTRAKSKSSTFTGKGQRFRKFFGDR